MFETDHPALRRQDAVQHSEAETRRRFRSGRARRGRDVQCREGNLRRRQGRLSIAGQVFKFSGFVSGEGSLGASAPADEHYAIVTYWRSFEEHEKSHADKIFTSKFEALAAMCTETREFGYDMLWQGEPEG